MTPPDRTAILGARLPDGQTADVYMADGRFVAIGAAPDGWQSDARVDARDQWLLPGAVDLCARLGASGQSDDVSLASELPVAAAAGIATVCLPPDTHAIIDRSSAVNWVRRQAAAAGGSEVCIFGALTEGLAGDCIAPLHTLVAAGCCGVSQSDGLPDNLLALRRALSSAAGQDVLVHLRPRIRHLAPHACVHDGVIAARRGIDGEPSSAESIAVATAIELARDTGARLHLGRLSTARGVGLVRSAKADGLPLSCDVAAHQLLLDEQVLADLHPRFHLAPPLRTADDRAALLAGVIDGTIDAVCSDHQPHSADAKTNPLPMTQPGGVTAELLLPALHTALGEHEDAQALMAQRLAVTPAQLLRRASPQIAPGSPAHCVLLDPEDQWTVDESQLRSGGAHSPLHGFRLRGRVRHAWLDGNMTGT